MKNKLITLIGLLATLTVGVAAQIIVGPGSGGSGGGTTIINNNITNVQNTTGTFTSAGCQVAWVEDYDFNVSACNYYIDNTNYQSVEQSITLDAAHATLDRIDVIALDNTSTVVKITGTPAADPSEPTVDPGTQIKLAIVLVTANTTQPEDISSSLLYLNNAGSPTEWNWTASGTGFNVNSTNNPISGATHSIEGTTVAPNAYAQGQIGSGTINPNNSTSLVLHIRSKATWTANRGLQVAFYNSGVLTGQTVVINPSGTWGFNSSTLGVYQQIVIPITNFNVPLGTLVNQVRIIKFGNGSNIGFYIGNITLQSGGTVPPVVNIDSGGKVAFTLGNGADAIATGWQGCAVAEKSGNINSAVLLSSASSSGPSTSIVLDVWKDVAANYPPTIADTITASSKPTLSSSVSQVNALTNWITTVAKGDIFCVNVDSNGGSATRAQLTISY